MKTERDVISYVDGLFDGVDVGRWKGAAVLGGLMGMAFEIQARERRRAREEEDARYERVMATLECDCKNCEGT